MAETQEEIIDDIVSMPFPFQTSDERSVIASLLESIPPSIEHAQWFRIAAAIKSSLGDAGFPLFDAWSQGGAGQVRPDAISQDMGWDRYE